MSESEGPGQGTEFSFRRPSLEFDSPLPLDELSEDQEPQHAARIEEYPPQREMFFGAEIAYDQDMAMMRWNRSEMPIVTGHNVPRYWEGLTESERQAHNVLRELNNVAYVKRNKGVGLEEYGDPKVNSHMYSIANEELEHVYTKTPGVRQALEIYVDIFRDYDNPEYKMTIGERRGVSIFQIQNRGEADKFRLLVENRLLGVVNEDHKKAAFAEQVAFDMLYAFNVFESLSMKWDEGGRWPSLSYRKRSSEASFVNRRLMGEMFPLNTLVEDSLQEKRDVGAGIWFAKQFEKNGIKQGGYNKLVAVPMNNEKVMKKNLWKIKNGTLYVPSAYPPTLLGCGLETFNVSGGTLLDYLEEQKEIPWNSVSGPVSAGYAELMSNAGYLLSAFKAKRRVKVLESKPDDLVSYSQITAALRKLPYLDTLQNRRALFHTTGVGYEPKSKLPKMAGGAFIKGIQEGIARKATDIGEGDAAFFAKWKGAGPFFPGDGIGIIERLLFS